jgi:hypothetical protein
MMKRVADPRKPRIRIGMLHKDSEGEIQKDQIQGAMEFVESLNKKIKPERRKTKLDTVNF